MQLLTPQRSEWPDPAPIATRAVVWSATADGKLALDERGYANLTYNVSEMRRYIEQQRAILKCYRGAC